MVHVEIVNAADNELYLRDKYYTPFLDLAIVYYRSIDGVRKYFVTHQEDIPYTFKQILDNIVSKSEFCLKQEENLILFDKKQQNKSIVAILDNQLLNSIQSQLGPFFILPQSTYELRIIPQNKIIQQEELENLKKKLTASNDNLPAEYIVSNHIYYYNRVLTVAV